MKYYGLFKNSLGEWITFARGDNKAAIYPTMDELRKAGIPDERIKIVKALNDEVYISYSFITLKMEDNVSKTFPLHVTNPQEIFMAYVQMAMSGQLKNVLAVTLEDACHRPMSEWHNSLKLRPKPHELAPETVQQLHLINAIRNGNLRNLYS